MWKADLDIALSGGVGVFENSLFVGSSEGAGLRLGADSGDVVWSTQLRGEVLSPPQSNGRVVVAQTYETKLQGLDFETRDLLWTYDSNLHVLTLRGTSAPILCCGLVCVWCG